MLLAVDSSSKAASCALWAEDTLLGEAFINIGQTHSQTLLPLVDQLLTACQCPVGEITAFALSVGPGSFTGLRIGLGLVKGLAFGGEIPCVPLSTLLGLAYNLPCSDQLLVPVMDARRSQLYSAAFQWQGGQLTQLLPDQLVTIQQLGEQLALLPGGGTALLVGDGALVTKADLGDLHPGLGMAPSHLLHQRASSLCLAASSRLHLAVPASQLVPSYLRRPQAERERLEQQG